VRTLSEKYLSDIPLSKDTYEVDLAVLDRYQAFSAELLRLALLGLAGYGFLIANVAMELGDPPGKMVLGSLFAARYPLGLGAVLLALAAICALGHRYFSTDSVTHHVRRLRLCKRIEALGGAPEAAQLTAIMRHESESLHKDLNRCRWLLVGSGIFLLGGTVCVACSFALTLFSAPSAAP
jgi:hypothetical protein